ncbi:peptide MFS transporter [Stackebrandtia nassauensis]|uniref:Amino acid/peptide transporter n=1 Tax=Stackebrandtia nassauensis (strain DSM 44728 / CIP 108903 / NRRL B-16338 / NBRC 102104 / LLR-40K-21) TaxID=446470 RepID=D3PZQ8_STANL|nr:oligopeptide:H+ symporter [Stackebrandtia nassauensis]ADD43595.1 amino acid/peptide transporter [Stackebrandtia nassauensis DSM 44728]
MTEGTTTASNDRSFFGHPWALATLFSTELWERFSFYGMRAILVLFLTASVANGGWGWAAGDANALYGVYNGFVYLMALPGAWIADRLIGARRSVLWGGVIIALGHYSLALPWQPTFFLGLVLIVCGTGLLKPNMSAMVGELYPRDDPRRDAGFSLFYMGINIGGFVAPLITGYLAGNVGWHMGFAAAGVGMTIAVIWYVVGGRGMGDLGREVVKPLVEGESAKLVRNVLIGGVLSIAACVAAVWVLTDVAGMGSSTAILLVITFVPIIVAVVYFVRMFADPGMTSVERSRVHAYVYLFVFAAAFWLIYDQAGSVINLFTEKDVDLDLPLVGQVSAAMLQSINPILIIIGSPLAAIVWLRLGHRLSTPVKFCFGLIFNGVAFILMSFAAMAAVGGEKVSPLWIVAVYAIQVAGELSLSPVGLSATTKLAPAGYLSQMLGLWFLANAVGDAIGGQVARLQGPLGDPGYFSILGGASLALGLFAVLFARALRSLMRGIH